MKIIFEGYDYNIEELTNVISEKYLIQNGGTAEVPYVGYYFDFEKSNSIFILPKVFIREGKAFGKYEIQSLLNPSPHILDSSELSFIFDVSVWLYKALKKYCKKDSLVDRENSIRILPRKGTQSLYLLDIVLSLVDFYKKNKDLIKQVYISSNSHNHKINWSKTIAKKLPYIVNNQPIYTEVKSKIKSIDYLEELITIYYSVLNNLKEKYGFNFELNLNYDLFLKKDYEKLLSKGASILKKIRYKYFSDKFIELWNLLYVFFDVSKKMSHSRSSEEVLLVRNFNLVFEDMVDYLISDSSLPSFLKIHKDGKRLDHIYKDKSLIGNDSIFFIGDSKYYKETSSLSENSIEKQFTYARNVIQYSFDDDLGIRFRDPLTEGYNITPNFFIYAILDSDLSFINDCLERTEPFIFRKQFPNRLFDRSTLFVGSYKINILYVLGNYTTDSRSSLDLFRDKARTKFRDNFIAYLNSKYRIIKISAQQDSDLRTFVINNFKVLNGVIYRSSDMVNSLLIALPNHYQKDDINPNIVETISDLLDNNREILTKEPYILD